MSLSEEKYLLLTTFKRDGTPVSTPVWIVSLSDGKLGFWTSSGSGKAKRLRHTGRVTVQPCDARGRVRSGTSPTDATAALVSGAALEEIRPKVIDKYGGLQVNLSKIGNTIGGALKRRKIPYGDCGVVITTGAPASVLPA